MIEKKHDLCIQKRKREICPHDSVKEISNENESAGTCGCHSEWKRNRMVHKGNWMCGGINQANGQRRPQWSNPMGRLSITRFERGSWNGEWD